MKVIIGGKRILIVASFAYSLTNFRGDLIKCLIKHGFTVYTAAPEYEEDVYQRLINKGAKPINFKLERTGLNPIKDFISILELKSIIKTNNIDLVFPYTIKPVIYSSIAARLSKTPVISLITGLGYAFTGLTSKARSLQKVSEFLYKISIRKNKVVVFQNEDDYAFFLDRKILKKSNKVAIVSGSGVNLNKYKYRVNTKSTDDIRFLLVARLIEEKGITLFVNAATILKKKYPNAEFHIIGMSAKSPSAIKLENLYNLHKKGVIIFHGEQKNVQEHLYKSDVFVLPSYYREGTPRSILEALSVGLPIITTKTPGCKETVKENYNGILINPKKIEDLIIAMDFFLSNTDKIKEMGINSRKYAEERFDVDIIDDDLLAIINEELKV